MFTALMDESTTFTSVTQRLPNIRSNLVTSLPLINIASESSHSKCMRFLEDCNEYKSKKDVLDKIIANKKKGNMNPTPNQNDAVSYISNTKSVSDDLAREKLVDRWHSKSLDFTSISNKTNSQSYEIERIKDILIDHNTSFHGAASNSSSGVYVSEEIFDQTVLWMKRQVICSKLDSILSNKMNNSTHKALFGEVMDVLRKYENAEQNAVNNDTAKGIFATPRKLPKKKSNEKYSLHDSGKSKLRTVVNKTQNISSEALSDHTVNNSSSDEDMFTASNQLPKRRDNKKWLDKKKSKLRTTLKKSKNISPEVCDHTVASNYRDEEIFVTPKKLSKRKQNKEYVDNLPDNQHQNINPEIINNDTVTVLNTPEKYKDNSTNTKDEVLNLSKKYKNQSTYTEEDDIKESTSEIVERHRFSEEQSPRDEAYCCNTKDDEVVKVSKVAKTIKLISEHRIQTPDAPENDVYRKISSNNSDKVMFPTSKELPKRKRNKDCVNKEKSKLKSVLTKNQNISSKVLNDRTVAYNDADKEIFVTPKKLPKRKQNKKYVNSFPDNQYQNINPKVIDNHAAAVQYNDISTNTEDTDEVLDISKKYKNQSTSTEEEQDIEESIGEIVERNRFSEQQPSRDEAFSCNTKVDEVIKVSKLTKNVKLVSENITQRNQIRDVDVSRKISNNSSDKVIFATLNELPKRRHKKKCVDKGKSKLRTTLNKSQNISSKVLNDCTDIEKSTGEIVETNRFSEDSSPSDEALSCSSKDGEVIKVSKVAENVKLVLENITRENQTPNIGVSGKDEVLNISKKCKNRSTYTEEQEDIEKSTGKIVETNRFSEEPSSSDEALSCSSKDGEVIKVSKVTENVTQENQTPDIDISGKVNNHSSNRPRRKRNSDSVNNSTDSDDTQNQKKRRSERLHAQTPEGPDDIQNQKKRRSERIRTHVPKVRRNIYEHVICYIADSETDQKLVEELTAKKSKRRRSSGTYKT